MWILQISQFEGGIIPLQPPKLFRHKAACDVMVSLVVGQLIDFSAQRNQSSVVVIRGDEV
jgi:hypothetical protein